MAITISGTTVTFNDSTTQTTNVPNATAALSVGTIGTYALLNYPGNTTNRTEGFTIAGSSLRYSATTQVHPTASAPPGSWRLMGALPYYTSTVPTPKGTTSVTNSGTVSVWLRYA
jgi:hypothetical protein